MLLAGIDLAWNGEKNPSAIAVGDLAGDSLVLANVEPAVTGMSEVLAHLTAREGLSGVAIDAPLIIRNQQGQRVCERDVSREYGSRGAGNLLDLAVKATRLRASVGEISSAMEAEWGRVLDGLFFIRRMTPNTIHEPGRGLESAQGALRSGLVTDPRNKAV